MKIGIMQPYFVPYIGYFQLIRVVDSFVFYDDVNYINRGWINRNNFLINGKSQLITLPCQKATQNKLINEIELVIDERLVVKLLKSIYFSYKKSIYFDIIYELFEKILRYSNRNLAKYSANSVIEICNFLELEVSFKFSSEEYFDTKGLDKADRLIEISKREGINEYVNLIGGQELYNKEYFREHGVELSFLQANKFGYYQNSSHFTDMLSIIDVLMFNGKEKTRNFLSMSTMI